MADLTLEELSALVGDDVEFWLGNPFAARDDIAAKVCRWASKVRAAEQAKASEWEATANRYAAQFEAEYERAEQAVRRLELAQLAYSREQQKVVEVRELADRWEDGDAIDQPYARKILDVIGRRCVACGEDADGPIASSGDPWCGGCYEAGEVDR